MGSLNFNLGFFFADDRCIGLVIECFLLLMLGIKVLQKL